MSDRSVRDAPVRVVAASRHPWRRIVFDGGSAHVAGDPGSVDALAKSLAQAADDGERNSVLRGADFLFAAIVETPGRIIAACDVVRSTPVYFARTASGWAAGNDARALAAELGSRTLDREALLEIEMAGYATGGATAYADLNVLSCGTYLVLEGATQAPAPQRYFRYLPEHRTGEARTAEGLGAVVDAAFDDLVRRARGRPVLVPISGGLDSRLVLAKLMEHRCPNLSCFSYGTSGNTDARVGREVAATLGVPWQFVASRGAAHRAFFRGAGAREFWRFADGLHCVPSPQDIVPFTELRAKLDPSTIVVNGQTGDFLSGGHIPAALRTGEIARSALLEAISAKHYGLWRSLMTPAHVRRIERRIEQVTGPLSAVMPAQEAITRYELWEYEARQATWVVNGQRTYEHLGLDWELPLWDPRLVRFFRDAPLDARIGQKLYREYLGAWDYRGLFGGFARPRSSWPGWTRPLAAVEKAAQVAGGPSLQRRANAVLRYFGHYRHQYAELGFARFMTVRHELRHILGHHARTWLTWNAFPRASETA